MADYGYGHNPNVAGPRGPQGKQGERGIQGSAGSNTPVTCLTAVAVVVGVAAIILSGIAIDNRHAGPAGPEGPEGPEGPAGKDGTPAPAPEPFCEQKADYSAMSPNPSFFKWNGPVGPGKIACGFLKAPMTYDTGYLEGEKLDMARAKTGYPSTEVYFCMQFADVKDTKGTLFVHCGGPGELSDCLGSVRSEHSTKVKNNYNFLAVDQRGIGVTGLKTGLSFSSCTGLSFPDNDIDFTRSNANIEKQERELAEIFEPQGVANKKCWDTPQFNNLFTSPKKRPTGEWSQVHFLRNSGTQALIQDMNLFRQAIGACSLSLHGISYGTAVVSAYATVFPQYTDKFIANSPTPPIQDNPSFAFGKGMGLQQLEDYKAYVIEKNEKGVAMKALESQLPITVVFLSRAAVSDFLQAQADVECNNPTEWSTALCRSTYGIFDEAEPARVEFLLPVLESMKNCVNKYGDVTYPPGDWGDEDCRATVKQTRVLLAVEASARLAGTTEVVIELTVDRLIHTLGFPALQPIFATATDANLDDAERKATLEHQAMDLLFREEEDRIVQMFQDGTLESRRRVQVLTAEVTACYASDGTSPNEACADINIPTTVRNVDDNDTALRLVDGQDRTNMIYSIQTGLGFYRTARNMLTDLGAMNMWIVLQVIFYQMPPTAPLAPFGSPLQHGIISSNLFDYQTEYKFAQQLKLQFPTTALITTPMAGHGLFPYGNNDYDSPAFSAGCFSLLDKYLEESDSLGQPIDGSFCYVPEPPWTDDLKDVMENEFPV